MKVFYNMFCKGIKKGCGNDNKLLENVKRRDISFCRVVTMSLQCIVSCRLDYAIVRISSSFVSLEQCGKDWDARATILQALSILLLAPYRNSFR